VSPFFIEDIHHLQLNSLKLISVVYSVFYATAVKVLKCIEFPIIVKGNL